MGLLWASHSTLIYISELILCPTITCILYYYVGSGCLINCCKLCCFLSRKLNEVQYQFINSRGIYCYCLSSFIFYTDCWTSSFANYPENEAWVKIEAIILVSINNAFVNRTTVIYLRCVILLGTNIIRCLSRNKILLLDEDSCLP